MYRITTRLLLTLLACAALVSPATAETLAIKPITDSSGKPPEVVMVELQHEAVGVWAAKGIKGKPLILLADMPALMKPRDDKQVDETIKSVRSGNADKVQARDYPTPVYYPVDGSNYIYYLYRLGIIDSLYWVPPVKGSVGDEPIDSFKDYMRSLGASEQELGGFKQEKTYIKGTVNGIPVHVSGLGEFSPPLRDSVMVIDAAFISTLYKNEVTEPMLDLFANFARTLSDTSPRVSHAVVAYTTAFGDVPLEQRFLGGYIRTLLAEPGTLSESPPDTWLLRAQAMYNDTFFQVEESFAVHKKAVEAAPEDAPSLFDLALAYFSLKDIDGMKLNLDKAVKLDNGYYPAYFKYADYFTDKGLYDASRDFLLEALKYAPEDPRILLGMHKLNLAEGDMDAAISEQKKIIDMGFGTPDNIIQLARDYSGNGDYEKSIEQYKRAMKMLPVTGDDRMPGLLMGLAETYEKARMFVEADKTFKKAFDSTPNKDVKGMISSRYQKFLKELEPLKERGVD